MQIIIVGTIIFLFIYRFLKKNHKEVSKSKPGLDIDGYEIVYTDQKGDYDKNKIVVSEMLYSEKYNLRGKPDYILANKSKTELIVVELKSGNIKQNDQPHYGDLMQLVAYFLIVEDVLGLSPKEGRLIYNDFMFVIPNEKELREHLMEIMKDMGNMIETGEGTAEPSFVKCRYCICKDTVCEYAETNKSREI